MMAAKKEWGPIPRYAMLDVWMAVGKDSTEFDAWADEQGYAEAWAWLCSEIRKSDVRCQAAVRRLDRSDKKAAAANKECEALRREVRTMRHANFILQHNIDATPAAGYKVRYEKVVEALQIIREVAAVEANGIPHETPTTLEPWLGPHWARSAPKPADLFRPETP